MLPSTLDKLGILADAAKFDASCSTSGSDRQNSATGIGNGAIAGICHSWSNDGRCVALLKVLFTNSCTYDCAYCRNRKSNDIPRATFQVDELVNLVIEFYKRNYIEGLFLSSGVLGTADHTMDKLTAVIKKLRIDHGYNGYIHMKTIPGASKELIHEAGLWADRLSVNIELPSNDSLNFLAPDKSKEQIFGSMHSIHVQKKASLETEPKRLSGKNAPDLLVSDYTPSYASSPMALIRKPGLQKTSPPMFLPAGQTTQMIVGASNESDRQILTLMQRLYNKFELKRVYYSAYIPINDDARLPQNRVPLRREHRLYQADWLFRFYQFDAEEILEADSPFLDEGLDPKSAWALRHPEYFPVDIQKARLSQLLRIPGVGPVSARRIIESRRHATLRFENLGKIGVVMKRARYFITMPGYYKEYREPKWAQLYPVLSDFGGPREKAGQYEFDFSPPAMLPSTGKIHLLDEGFGHD